MKNKRTNNYYKKVEVIVVLLIAMAGNMINAKGVFVNQPITHSLDDSNITQRENLKINDTTADFLMSNDETKAENKEVSLLVSELIKANRLISTMQATSSANISTVTDTSSDAARQKTFTATDIKNNMTLLYTSGTQDQWVSATDPTGNQYLQLVGDGSQQFGYGVLKKQISATSDFKINGFFNPTNLSSNGSSNSGDWVGIAIVPVDPNSFIVSSDGGALGIANTANAFALGIDMYRNNNYNDPSDGPFGALRWTNSNGTIQGFGSMNQLYTSSQDLTQWRKSISYEFYYHYNNGNPYITGNLIEYGNGNHAFYFDTRNPGGGTPLTVNVPSSGFFTVYLNAANGSNHQAMRANMSVATGQLYATNATIQYQVDPNIVAGGGTIAPSTTLKSATRDVIGVTGISSGAIAGTDDYTYDGSVPATSDIKYKSGWHPTRTVSKDGKSDLTYVTDSSQNVFTIYYAPDYQQAILKTDATDPTGAKTVEAISGTTGGTMTGWTKKDADLVRTGYSYIVTAPDGKTYSTLSAAQASVTTYDSTSNGSATTDSALQNFVVTYTASYQQAIVKTDTTDPTGAKTVETISGTTGGTMSGWTKTDTDLARSGYSYTVLAPNGQTYTTLSAAQAAVTTFDNTANGTATTDSAPQNFVVSYGASYQQAIVKTDATDPTGAKTVETISGTTGGTMTGWTKKDADLTRAGYSYTVTAPNGQVYNTLSAAQAAVTTFDNTANGTATTDSAPQNYIVSYTKSFQQANVKTDTTDPTGAKTVDTISGTTGSTMSGWTKTDTDLARAGNNYTVLAPNGQTYNSLSEAQAAVTIFDTTANGTATTDSAPQNFIVTYKAFYQQANVLTDSSDPNGAQTVDTISGTSEKPMTGWTKTDTDLVRPGYSYSITAPNGQVYSTLSAAQSAVTTFDTTANGTATTDSMPQNFTVSYTKLFQQAIVRAVKNADTVSTATLATYNNTNDPTLGTPDKPLEEGTTGNIKAAVSDSGLAKSGYTYTVTGPDNVVYNTMQLAWSSNNNNVWDKTNNPVGSTTDSSPQVWVVNYTGLKQTAILNKTYTDGSSPDGNIATVDGPSGSEINFGKADENLKVANYDYVIKVYGTDGTTVLNSYTTLQEALNNYPDYDETDNSANPGTDSTLQKFVVEYTPSEVNVTFNYLDNNGNIIDSPMVTQQAPGSDIDTSDPLVIDGYVYESIDTAKSDSDMKANVDGTSKIFYIYKIDPTIIQNANTAITNANNSNVANEQSVKDAIKNVQDALNSTTATADKIKQATDALNQAVTDAQANRQTAANDANTALAATAPVTHETDVNNAVSNLNNVLADSNSTSQQIKTATDALTNAVASEKTNRTSANNSANSAITKAQNDPVDSQDPGVQTAIQNLQDVMNRAAADSATDLTADIINATNSLNTAMSSSDAAHTQAITDANNVINQSAPVSNETAVSNALENLNTVLSESNSSTEDITSATQALQNALDTDKPLRNTADSAAGTSITNAKNSNVNNEKSVQDAISALENARTQAAADSKDYLTEDLEALTAALDNAVSQAQTDRQTAIDKANEAKTNANNSEVKNESSVSNAQQNLDKVLADSTSTTDQIKQATDALNQAVTDATTNRNNAKDAANQAKQDAQPVIGDSEVLDAVNNLDNVLNNPNSTTQEINDATNALEDATNDAKAAQQAAIDAANSVMDSSNTKPVTHEPKVEQALTNLQNVIANSNSTADEITNATKALSDELITAKTDRNHTVDDANSLISVVDQSAVSKEASVVAAENNLKNIMSNAASDDQNALTQDIKNAMDALKTAQDTAQTIRDQANQAISDANNSTVNNETAVQDKVKELQDILNNPNSTTQEITDATDALNQAVSDAKTDRQTAIDNANQAKTDADNSQVKNDPAVSDAENNLNNVLNNPNSTTQDIKDATDNLNNAVTDATTTNNNAKDAANQVLDPTNTAPVSNEQPVADTAANLQNALNNPNSTTQEITDATAALNDTLTAAKTARSDANTAADNEIANANNSNVANEPSVQNEIKNLQEIQKIAATDSPQALTKDITDATNALNKAVQQAQADRQTAIDNANKAKTDADNSDVKNEPSINQAETDLNDVLSNPNSTTQQIKDATDNLNSTVSQATTDRNNATDAANQAINQADPYNSETSVADAKNNLENVLNNPNSTTQEITDATDKLNDEVSKVNGDRAKAVDEAKRAVLPSNTSPVSNESAVSQAIDNLNDTLNNPNSTTQQIKDATDTLNSTVDAEKSNRNDANAAANNTISDAQSSNVVNESSVQEAIKNLQTVQATAATDSSNALTKDITAATTALENANKQAQTDRQAATDNANQAKTDANNSTVGNEPSVANAESNLDNVLNNPNSTTQQIKEATDTLNNTVDQAAKDRQTAIDNANQAINSANSVENNSSVNEAKNNLTSVLNSPNSTTQGIKNSTEVLNKVVNHAKNSSNNNVSVDNRVIATANKNDTFVPFSVIILIVLLLGWIESRKKSQQKL